MLYLRPKNKSGCFTDATSTLAWISLISITTHHSMVSLDRIYRINRMKKHPNEVRINPENLVNPVKKQARYRRYSIVVKSLKYRAIGSSVYPAFSYARRAGA